MITLTLPYPVSANVYWRSFVPRGHSRAIVTLSDEAKAYKAAVGKLVREAGKAEWQWTPPAKDEAFIAKVNELAEGRSRAAWRSTFSSSQLALRTGHGVPAKTR